MGNSLAKAEEQKGDAKAKLETLKAVLENRRREFITRVELARGRGANSEREIQGGRSVSRVSEIRVQTENGVDPGIKSAIGNFFEIAQGGDTGKQAAVEGATKLLSAGLDALFGANAAGGMEKEGFVVLFLNYAFVRVDFYVYSYSASGSKWGAKAFESGSCYVADIAVLDPIEDVRPGEIDFLLAQSLYAPPPDDEEEIPENEVYDNEFYAILRMKIQLVESAILSRLLGQENLTIEQLRQYTTELVATQRLIQEEFRKLEDFTED